jgi:hypothetical protein
LEDEGYSTFLSLAKTGQRKQKEEEEKLTKSEVKTLKYLNNLWIVSVRYFKNGRNKQLLSEMQKRFKLVSS